MKTEDGFSLYEVLTQDMSEAEKNKFSERADLPWIKMARSYGIENDINDVDFWVSLAMKLAFEYHPDFIIKPKIKVKRKGRKSWRADQKVASKRICIVSAVKDVMQRKGISTISNACRLLLHDEGLLQNMSYEKLAADYREYKKDGVVELVEKLMTENGISARQLYWIFYDIHKEVS